MVNRKHLVLGIIASILIVCSDCLIGYCDPTIDGNVILRLGYAYMTLWRPIVSMALCIIAVPLFVLPLWSLYNSIQKGKLQKTFGITSIISILGWACMHLYYTMMIYILSSFAAKGQGEIAFEVVGDAASAFLPFIFLYVLVMAIQFIVYFISVFQKKTFLPKWFAFLTPAPLFVLFYMIRFLLPSSDFAGALSMSVSNVTMLILFISVYILSKRQSMKAT
jgi:hypothetical protein